MRILAIDIGTGTQDILAFDTSLLVANCPKIVAPSPTSLLRDRIQKATAARASLLFTGVTMGGGPSKWALRQHLRAGATAYATPDAARTFDDDLDAVREMGAIIVSEDEARRLQGVEVVQTRDIDLPSMRRSLESLGIEPDFDVVAVAVLDHGEAPPEVSDRTFRFQHMRRTLLSDSRLSAFAYLPGDIPPYLTRMNAVVQSVSNMPALIMDTGPAAILGAAEDSSVSGWPQRLVLNMGNSHIIAFHLHGSRIKGMFEHHTHSLEMEKLESMLRRLASGELSNAEVFEDGGHGCAVLSGDRRRHPLVVVGPQRQKLAGSTMQPYFAVPYGDMMLTGCYGLVRACALRFDRWRSEIEQALARSRPGAGS